MMERVLVLGASGFVGRALMDRLGERALGTYASRPVANGVRFDAASDDLDSLLAAHGPFSHAVVLFGVIDPLRCAREPEATARVNVEAAISALSGLANAGVTPVYLSSDYVFDGAAGNFREDDPVAPVCAYGRQKALVEQWLAENLGQYLLVRTAKVYADLPGAGGILNSMIDEARRAVDTGETLVCASDQRFSPTLDTDLARGLEALMAAGETGTWHVCGPRALKRRELLALVLERLEIMVGVRGKPINDFGLPEPWPVDTSLDAGKHGSRFGALTDVAQALNRLVARLLAAQPQGRMPGQGEEVRA